MQLSKILSTLPKRRLKQIPFLLILMVIGALFEVLGIGLVLPLIDVISGDNSSLSKFFEQILPGLSTQNTTLLIVAMFAAVYVFKGVYLSILAWVIGRFIFAVKAEISNILMKGYLRAPYEFHLEQNSSHLLRNVSTESNQLVNHVLVPILSIATEFVVILAVSIFLMFLEPIGTISVLLLLVTFSFFFHRIFGAYMEKIGRIRHKAEGMFIQTIQEALGGIKDVKVLGKEQHFLEKFRMHNQTLSDVSSRGYILSQIPRVYLETLGILVFLSLIILLILKGGDFGQVIPVLGVFTLAAFRLLPSANRIITYMNSLRFADNVVEMLNDHLTRIDLTNPFEPSVDTNTEKEFSAFNQSIEIKNLCYQYPQADKLALSNINLTIKKGESIGIIGKSGAGKSTLSDTILGLIKPSKGGIYIDGVDIYKDIKSWQNLIGYVQQDIYLLDDSIRNNIAFGEHDDKIDSNKINNAIIESQLGEYVSSLSKGMDTKLGERGVRLSGGQKQRIGIARALYRNTPILVFDEATSALDNETESEIVSAIRSFKGIRTTIVIAHRLSTIEHCDRVIELKDGCISKNDESK
jgi:ATP-binding cassette, subfamily B, bacterial PglK